MHIQYGTIQLTWGITYDVIPDSDECLLLESFQTPQLINDYPTTFSLADSFFIILVFINSTSPIFPLKQNSINHCI